MAHAGGGPRGTDARRTGWRREARGAPGGGAPAGSPSARERVAKHRACGARARVVTWGAERGDERRTLTTHPRASAAVARRREIRPRRAARVAGASRKKGQRVAIRPSRDVSFRFIHPGGLALDPPLPRPSPPPLHRFHLSRTSRAMNLRAMAHTSLANRFSTTARAPLLSHIARARARTFFRARDVAVPRLLGHRSASGTLDLAHSYANLLTARFGAMSSRLTAHDRSLGSVDRSSTHRSSARLSYVRPLAAHTAGSDIGHCVIGQTISGGAPGSNASSSG